MYRNIAERIYSKVNISVNPKLIVKLPESENQAGIHVETYAVRCGPKTIVLHYHYNGDIVIDALEP